MHPGRRPGARRDDHPPEATQGGFTFIAVLIALALIGLALAAVGPAWSAESQREHEDELLRIGVLYAQAIAEYRDNSPGSIKAYPDKLEWLTLDTRFVGVTRHLRKLYADPMNPGQPWGLIKDDGGHITGVYSLSALTPFKQRPLEFGTIKLAAAQHYADWKFKPPVIAPVSPVAPGAPSNNAKLTQ